MACMQHSSRRHALAGAVPLCAVTCKAQQQQGCRNAAALLSVLHPRLSTTGWLCTTGRLSTVACVFVCVAALAPARVVPTAPGFWGCVFLWSVAVCFMCASIRCCVQAGNRVLAQAPVQPVMSSRPHTGHTSREARGLSAAAGRVSREGTVAFVPQG